MAPSAKDGMAETAIHDNAPGRCEESCAKCDLKSQTTQTAPNTHPPGPTSARRTAAICGWLTDSRKSTPCAYSTPFQIANQTTPANGGPSLGRSSSFLLS